MEEGEEFSGGGNEGDFGRFAGGAQAGIKEAQLRMMTGGAQGAEVEDAAGFWTTAVRMTSSAKGAALVIARSQARKAAEALARAVAEFGQHGEQGGGADRSDTRRLLQPRGFGGPHGMSLEVLPDERLDLFEPLLQGREALLEVAPEDGHSSHFAVLLFAPDELGELVAPADQGGQSFDPFGWRGRGRWGEQRADPRQHRAVERIVFREVTKPSGELPHAGGMEHANRHRRLAQGGHDRAFIAAGGFADDLHGGVVRGDLGAQLGVACRSIGQGGAPAVEADGERCFGHVEAQVDEGRSHGIGVFFVWVRVGVALCLVMRTRPAAERAGSGNCSSKHPQSPRAIRLSSNPLRRGSRMTTISSGPVRGGLQPAPHLLRAPRKSSRSDAVGHIQG